MEDNYSSAIIFMDVIGFSYLWSMQYPHKNRENEKEVLQRREKHGAPSKIQVQPTQWLYAGVSINSVTLLLSLAFVNLWQPKHTERTARHLNELDICVSAYDEVIKEEL